MSNYIGRPPSGVVSAPGRLLQVVSHVRGDAANSAAVVPLDNTIPQIGEGVEFFTINWTPKQIGSRARIRCLAMLVQNTAGNISIVGALFKDAGPDALMAQAILGQQNFLLQMMLETELVALDLTPVTISARFGPAAATTVRLNQTGAAAALFGGAAGSFLKLEEFSQ